MRVNYCDQCGSPTLLVIPLELQHPARGTYSWDLCGTCASSLTDELNKRRKETRLKLASEGKQ